eukprot:jgi/Chlat1/7385/Chrsp6S07421
MLVDVGGAFASGGGGGASVGGGAAAGEEERQASGQLPSGRFIGSCENCDNPAVNGEYKEVFGIDVCFGCRRDLEHYRLVTKSEAKDKWLLTDADLRKLRFVNKENPRHRDWSAMALYLKKQVMEASYRKHGGEHGLAVAHEEALQARLQRSELKRRKSDTDARVEQARQKRIAEKIATEVLVEEHKHVYPDESEAYDEEEDVWTKTCACGFSIEYEKL